MTHQEFADAVGVSRGAVQQWERGSTAPTRKRQPAVAEYMGISVAELMQGYTPLPAPGGGAVSLDAAIAVLADAIERSRSFVSVAQRSTTRPGGFFFAHPRPTRRSAP